MFSINSAVKTNQLSNRFYIEGTDNIYFTIFETISTSFTSASAVAKVADGVVVGSSIVKLVAANAGNQEKIITEISSFLAGLRKAMDEN